MHKQYEVAGLDRVYTSKSEANRQARNLARAAHAVGVRKGGIRVAEITTDKRGEIMTDKAEKWTKPWIVRADWSQTTGDAYVIDNEKSAEHDANLQLIASAPKLYKALEMVLNHSCDTDSEHRRVGRFTAEECEVIDAALRAARGEK